MAIIPTTPPHDCFGFSHQFPERYFYLMVYLLMTHGLRQCELLALTPESLNLARRILTVTSPKSRTTRQVPISPDLYGILAAYFQEQGRARQATMARLKRVRRLLRVWRRG